MKTATPILWIIAVVLSAAGSAQQPQAPGSSIATADVTPPTPAQLKIDAAQRQLQADPKKVSALNELALGYIRRARETSDTNYLRDAGKSLAQGLAVEPKDFQLQRTQVELMLALHQYAQAKQRATELNLQTPDDVMTYGFLAEAEIAQGDYDDAVRNTQWMMNMRPNNIPCLLLGAKLRLLHGDSNGAIEFLKLAAAEISPEEVEELAGIYDRIAVIEIETGNLESAGPILDHAAELFPDYAPTLEATAALRMHQQRPAEAVALLLKAEKLDRDPHLLYELAQAQTAAGKTGDSRTTLADFQKLAAEAEDRSDESTRDLILLYAQDAAHAPRALEIALHSVDARHDLFTLDAYAWALYANGKYTDADAQMQKALATGMQNAEFFDHAGHIAQKLHREADAQKYFELSIRTNPTSEFAADARKALGLKADKQLAGPVTPVSAPVTGPSVEARPAVSTLAGPAPVDLVPETAAFAPVPAKLLVPLPTETDRYIHKAQSTVAVNPKDAAAWAALGAAHFQRARETGDVADYQQAEESLTKSLDLTPDDFSSSEALATMSEVCMGEHRFADAITYAQKALALGSGDVSPFAIIGDAYADMGDYDKAKAAYARLTPPEMTLSPRAAYARDSRLAYLRFVAGDTQAAIALMQTSVAEGVEAQLPSENLAWLYYELGEFYMQAGDAARADRAYLAALNIHPGDYRALAGLAKLRANQGHYDQAIVLYQRAIAVVPMPIFVAELGDLYSKTGNPAEAKKQYQLVEYIGLLGHINQVLHNRDLAIFYADHDIKLDEALDLAHKELEVRRDVYTWDALAWALYKNGKLTEAMAASQKALKYGTRDALLLYHAGVIADRAGHPDEALNDLRQAMAINPHFHLLYAPAAKKKLTLLETEAANRTGSQAGNRAGADNHAR